jgi:alpha-L-rhamnosidase
MKQGQLTSICPVRFRRSFHVKETPHHARLDITAQGIYESFVNGSKTGGHVLAPGWSSYDHELSYQTFDILPQLKIGASVIATEVAKGCFMAD